jgi:predicted N-formylglutamate amidohydrolase
LRADDPPPLSLLNQGGTSPYLILGDHAGRAIPGALGQLGLEPDALDLHIAWDIGVAGLGERVAEMLDACFISQPYSRLVIDCNRGLESESSIAIRSDGIAIPGNAELSAANRVARQDAIHRPYHTAIAAELERRVVRRQPTLLFSLHSFTPVFDGFRRPWRFGVLHRADSVLSRRVLSALQDEFRDAVGDNEPYKLDEKDYSVPFHADSRGLDYLELEVRQDLIAEPRGQEDVASLLARVLRPIAAELFPPYPLGLASV